MARREPGPETMPAPHSPEWRLQVAQAMIRAEMSRVASYLADAGDPNPAHTASQAIWREAIETTAEAVTIANDNAAPALQRERFGEDLLD